MFDLSHAGQYTVYMDVADVTDRSSNKSLRTNSAKFAMQAPTH